MHGVRKFWKRSERFRQASWALLIALVAGVSTILQPIDIALWSIQGKMFHVAPSREIAFVAMHDATNSREPQFNRKLAKAIDALARGGADRIYVDLPLHESNNAAANDALRQAIANDASRIVLTQRTERDLDGRRLVKEPDPLFQIPGTRMVSADREVDFLQFTWIIDREVKSNGTAIPTLAYDLSDRTEPREAIYPDYAIDVRAVDMLSDHDIDRAEGRIASRVAGKRVVIGDAGAFAETPRKAIPASLIHVLGAETIIRGTGDLLWWPYKTASLFLLLVAGALSRSRKRRAVLYGAAVSLWLLQFPVLAYFGVRSVMSASFAMLSAYGGMRAAARFKRRHLLISGTSGLPNFVALKQDLAEAAGSSAVLLIVKILRFEAISSIVSSSEQTEYIRQIAKRIAVTDGNAHVYYDGSKYLAVTIAPDTQRDLPAHLSGLRAVICQPISIGTRPLDVSVTIGASCKVGGEPGSKLNSAMDAADRAEEAYHPIEIVADGAQDSREWDYSLQAKLDAALENDRISVLFQPQIDFASNRICGAEALARWIEDDGTEVSPALFIGQSEKVGRLDELTRRIVQRTFAALQSLSETQPGISLSINVSAIQLVDDRVLRILAGELRHSEIDADRIVVEVTETARIEDFAAAGRVIQRIKRLGFRVALDDFGVGAASLEALLQLPVDEVKIDRLFVSSMRGSTKAQAIVTNTIAMARQAGLRCVAEGIEFEEQFALLRKLGCECGQGFHISRPHTLAEFRVLLENQSSGVGDQRKHS